MEKRGIPLNSVFAVILIIACILSGCGQKKQQPEIKQQSMQETGSPEKSSEQLKELEGNIEKIIKALDGPAIESEKEQQGKEQEGEDKNKQMQQTGTAGKGQEGTQGEGQGQQKQGTGQGGGGQGGMESGGGQGGGEQKPPQSQQPQGQQKEQTPQQADPWSKITPIINKLHYQWNSYMPQAAKLGASRKQIDDFGNALISLTDTVIGKNKTNTLMAASYLYAYVPDFYSLYKTGMSPEIKRIRYYTRNAMLNAMTANWTQADYDINSLKASWSLFKSTVSSKQQEHTGKLDFSIYELEKVIKERNQPLTDIKGRVSMANIQALEGAMEKEQRGGQGGAGGGQGGAGQGGMESGGGQGGSG